MLLLILWAIVLYRGRHDDEAQASRLKSFGMAPMRGSSDGLQQNLFGSADSLSLSPERSPSDFGASMVLDFDESPSAGTVIQWCPRWGNLKLAWKAGFQPLRILITYVQVTSFQSRS